MSDSERIQSLEHEVAHLRRMLERLTRHPATIRSAAREVERKELAPILNAVCDIFGVSRDQLLGRSRLAWIVDARQVAMALVQETGLPAREVSRFFGRDRSLVGHSVRAVADKAETDPHFARLLASVREQLGEQTPRMAVCAA